MQPSQMLRPRLDRNAMRACTNYSQPRTALGRYARGIAAVIAVAAQLWPSVSTAQSQGSMQGQGLGIAENNIAIRRHLDFAGKACLETTGVSQPLASNPHILNHAVELQNHCIEKIKAKVCYYRSDQCTDVEVPAHASKVQIIGVFPAMQDFRYEVKEQF